MTGNKPLIKNGEILELYATGVRDFTGYKLYISDDIVRSDLSSGRVGTAHAASSILQSVNQPQEDP